MFMKITTAGPRRYVQLVESYRDEAGRVKKRTVATLGRLDQLTGERLWQHEQMTAQRKIKYADRDTTYKLAA